MVNLSENTKLTLKPSHLWTFVLSVIASAFVVGVYVTELKAQNREILVKLTDIDAKVSSIESSFKEIHKAVVDNHDDIIVLKQKIGVE